MSSKLLPILKRWWFWLCVVLLCAIPTEEFGGSTGDHYFYGVPFPSLYVKHGNMGIGGRFSEGFLFFPDGSPRPASGVRSGWFIQPEPIGIVLNASLSVLVVYGITQIWQKIRRVKQDG